MYRFGRCIFIFYWNVFNRLKIKGKENIVEDGPLIVFSNHFSDVDPILLAVAFKRKIRFMAKKSLFETPIVKHIVKSLGAFPVDRDGNDISAVKTALRILKNNEVLGIFPEGTRVRNGKVSDPKGGFSMIGYKTKAPMQPVHIKYKRKLMIFNSVEVIIGKPIQWDMFDISEVSSEGYKNASEELMKTVYELE